MEPGDDTGRSASPVGPGQRRLAAILFSDIVGYTALMERDEAAAIRVREVHRTLIASQVARFEGEIVETPGDEALAVFPSAIYAVDFGLQIQEAARDVPDLSLRIGIHLGEVVRRDGEVMGDDVNIAARIRPLAEPGGVCISEPVWSAVRNRSNLRLKRLGRKSLKHVDRPIEVWSVAAGAEPRRRRWHLRVFAAGALLLAMLVAAALWTTQGRAIAARALVQLVPLVVTRLEQDLRFATTSDGVRIAFATTGEGPVVVSVVGWASHLEKGIGSGFYDLHDIIRSFSESYQFVRYDGRGFGLSERDAEDFSLDARVRDVEAVVDAIGAQRVTLIGISSGGPAAIAYAARYPDRVDRLVLHAAQAGGYRYTTEERREMLVRSFDLFRHHWDQPEVRGIMADMLNIQNEVMRSVGLEFLRISGDGPAIAGFMEATGRIDLREDAEAVRAPTLIIHGRDDTTVPYASSVELATWISGARFELVPGLHIPDTSVEDMRYRTELILDFLAESGSDGSSR